MKAKFMYVFAAATLFSFAIGMSALPTEAHVQVTRTKVSVAKMIGQEIAGQKASAQEEAPPAVEVPAAEQPPEVSDDSFYKAAIDAVLKIAVSMKQEGVSKVAVALAALLALAQLLIQLTKTALFGKIFPKAGHLQKLAIVSVCTVITTLVPMLLSGVPFWTALLSGGVFTAIMVAGNQVWQGFFPKKS